MKITKVAILVLAIAIALYIVLPNLSWAEESVSAQSLPTAIDGTVLDPTDNTIAGATVVLQGLRSRDRYTTLSNDNGFFEFRGLKSGISYRVTVHADGFEDWTSPVVVLGPGQFKILTGCKLRLQDVKTTVNVGYSSVEVATEQVKAAEKQRVLGIAPNFYAVYDRNPEPLTAKLKFELALKTTVDPVTIFGVALVAGLDQAGNTPNYQQGAKGYGQRFGTVAANGSADILVGGAILPTLLHQDPRYFYKGTGTTKSRILYALTRPLVCKGDNGAWQPNYSSMGGDLAAAALENAYYPQSNRGAGLVFGHFALGTAERAVSSLAQEFLLRRLTQTAKDLK